MDESANWETISQPQEELHEAKPSAILTVKSTIFPKLHCHPRNYFLIIMT